MQKQVEPKDDGRSALPPYGHDEPGVVILASPLRRRGPEIRKGRWRPTASALCSHTDDGTLGNACELHAGQQARRSARHLAA
ncbi:hypothetical protein, partial [Streptomyces hydrogenans]